MGFTDSAIEIINHSDKAIDILSIQDNLVVEQDRKKKLTIGPKQSFVIFIDRVESLSWEKQK